MDEYRLTDLEEPRDEWLEQIMREAAEDAAQSNQEALEQYFDDMRRKAALIA